MATAIQSPARKPSPPPENNTNAAARFGTFAGVFTPNVLTILGIIIFLRSGWVVGQAGLIGAFIIVGLANSISFLTGLSLSAIATNMRVRAGGNYYLISRSLGLEIGGAIGIPLYLSQAISVAFYVIGFTEALRTVTLFADINPQLIAAGVVLVFVAIAYVGADFALRIQFFILAILAASLLSFFTGGWTSIGEPTLEANYTEGVGFWLVFATFFPAVTGIEVGTSLSGDLKDPSKSIPRGTLSSIIFTSLIYFAAIYWLSVQKSPEQLISDDLPMESIATIPALILLGVWASTLSSALGSVLAAPRTLQAIANDNVVPRWAASNLGSRTEPRMAVLITAGVALAVVALGDLDFVAPIISMFFLNTYGMVNLAAAIEQLVGNPSYRPRFQVPWQLSLLGSLGCYGAMLLINPIATVAAIVISYGFFATLERRQIRRAWGDVGAGFWFAITRYALLQLEQEHDHAKNWRPNLMVFTGQPHNRLQLVQVADWLSMGRGIVTFFQFIIDPDGKRGPAMAHLRSTARKHIQQYIDEHGMTAFAECEVVPDFRSGVLTVAQAHGIGRLEANTILLGWSGTEHGRAMQMGMLRDLATLGKSVVFLYNKPDVDFGRYRTINIWWKGRGGNADLMLLLAYIIENHRRWNGAKVQLLRVVDSPEAVADTTANLEALINEARVDAEPLIVVRDDPKQPLTELIEERNLYADLTMMGLGVPDEGGEESYSKHLHNIAQSVGTLMFVYNAQYDEDLLLTEE